MVRVNRFFLMIAVAVISLYFCCSIEASEKTNYSIVISENAKTSELFAAEKLSEYLSAVSGETYPIIKDSKPFAGYGFYVGDTSVYNTSDVSGKTDGSYNLVPFNNTKGKGLAIYGSGTRGTIYGVYGFLEDYCGYRCFTAEMGMQSVTGQITLPEQKVEFNSCFEYTDTDWKSPSDPEYSLANGLNGDPHRTLTEEQGGDVDYLGGFCHTLTTNFCAASTYYSSHPEYFALHDGKRVPNQLCLTNKNVYNTVLSEVMTLLNDRHDPSAPLQIISLTQNDNLDYCECDNCRALDEANGSHAGSIITFVNKIALAVKKAGYSNVAIDCFAYQYSRKAPTNVVPEDNVIVRFCTIESCFSHPINDANCPKNVEMMEDITAWNKICDRLYVWDYTTNYGYPIGIFPDFGVLQANMQFFAENDIKGVYEEGNYFISECDSEFGELRSYLISRLLRDPYCDYDREMELFCNAFYGNGGSYLKEFIDGITECSVQKHVTIYSPMTESFSITEDKAKELDTFWANAQDASSESQVALKAIERSMLSWRYVKACLGLSEFKGSLEDSMNEREQLYNDLISHGVKQIDEWYEIKEDFESYRFIPIEEWPYADIIHILHYDANGGSEAPLTQWSNGYIVITSKVPTRNGYTFLGWSSERYAKTVEYRPGEYFTLTDDMTLYAVWDGDDIPESGDSDTPVLPVDPDPSDEEDGYDDEQEFIAYNISVAGNDINSTIAKDLSVINGITLENGGYARYNPGKRTLYLKDAVIETPDDAINDRYGLWADFHDETDLVISVKGHCRIIGGSIDQGFSMSLAVWGNLTILLEEGAILDIEAPSAPEVYDNTAMYIGENSELVIDGPGTLNLIGGSANTLQGTSYAGFLSGSVTFKGGCTVNACGGSQAAVGKGLCIEGSRLVFKDNSMVNLRGGDAGQSIGMQFMSDGDHEFITDGWTGSLSIEGRTCSIPGGTETFTRNQSDTLLYGRGSITTGTMRLLKKETYTSSELSRYKKLLLSGSNS